MVFATLREADNMGANLRGGQIIIEPVGKPSKSVCLEFSGGMQFVELKVSLSWSLLGGAEEQDLADRDPDAVGLVVHSLPCL